MVNLRKRDWENIQALIDQRIDASVLDHSPRILGSLNVALAVKCDVAERVAVDELHCPVEQTNKALQDAEEYASHDIAFLRGRLLRNRAKLAQAVDDGDHQAAEADTSKAVRHRATECASCRRFREVVGAEVPTAIDAGDRDMDNVLQNLRNVVSSKGNENDEANDLASSAPASTLVACRIVPRLVFDVDCDEGYRIPRGEGCCEEASDEADEVYFTKRQHPRTN